MPAALRIGVIGEGTCSKRTAALARRGGAEVARAGAVLFSGGRGGVMEAASRGASEAGGLVVGILPGFRGEDANRWVAVPVVTGMDQARNIILGRSCHAVIAVGGMYGPLSEIAIALKIGRPVIGLGTWRLGQPQGRPVPVIRAATPEAAVTLAIRAARSGRGSRRWLS